MEQLLAFLGEGLPPFLTEATREAHLLGLLEDAAEACRARGESFVLLVDGLDEDRGAHSGHSIAGVLPADPPAGMRIVVASRPNPPIPGDVPGHHPLRDPAIVRSLTASPQAQAVRGEMERDLQRLLNGSVAEQDLLGLVASAGGGLSDDDLADLSSVSRWQVGNHLHTVSGRSFSLRGSHYAPEVLPDVYLLGHEDLQVTALDMLGTTRVAGYRQLLHEWFRQYQKRGWPANTPEYLLRGYFNMVHATNDLDAMVTCTTDPARQDRMLDISGGDVTALAEIVTGLDVIGAQDTPDLVSMVRLAIHRDYLRGRNSKIPGTLPEVWALLGQFNRAEAMANSITDPQEHDRALSRVAVVMAESRKLDQAELLALSLADPRVHVDTLATVANTAATINDRDRVIRLIELVAAAEVPEHEDKMTALALAAEAAARAGELDRAVGLLDSIMALTGLENLPSDAVRAVIVVSSALATNGATDRARDLSTLVPRAMDACVDRYQRKWLLMSAAEGAAAINDLPGTLAFIDEARSVLSGMDYVVEDLVLLATVAAAAGGLDRAATLLDETEALILAEGNPHWLSQVTVEMVEAAIAIGDRSRAVAFIDRAADLAAADGSRWRAELNSVVAKAAVIAGDTRRAREFAERSAAVARAVVDVQQHASALASVAEAAAAVGDECADDWLHRAEAVARTIDTPVDKLRALGQVAKTAALTGDIARAREFVRGVETYDFMDDFIDPDNQSWLFEVAIEVMAMAGDLDRAAHLLAQGERAAPTHPAEDRVRALMPLTRAAVVTGLPARTAALADELEMLVPEITADSRSEALAYAALARAATGKLDRAAALLDQAEEFARLSENDDWQRDRVPISVAMAAGAIDVNRVDRVVQGIVNPRDQATALALTAERRPPSRRAQAVAQALRLADWYIPVRPLVKLAPAALPVIVAELEIVQR